MFCFQSYAKSLQKGIYFDQKPLFCILFSNSAYSDTSAKLYSVLIFVAAKLIAEYEFFFSAFFRIYWF